MTQILIGILIGVTAVLAYQDPTVIEYIRSNINDLSTYMVKATSDVAVVVSH
jgi:hypothetical protein|tara:strand:+ start:1514 stop:1669 length:156 start_codon:yes stop_codon:yes gene_type:complete